MLPPKIRQDTKTKTYGVEERVKQGQFYIWLTSDNVNRTFKERGEILNERDTKFLYKRNQMISEL